MRRFWLTLLMLTLATAGMQAQSAGDSDAPVIGTLGVVGTAHLDTQWRWTIKNTIEEFIPATMRENFKLFDLYHEYVFSFEGAFRYQLMKEYYPEDYERLKAYIKEGRWRVCGSWVDAVDVNMPSFEALVRHSLYGNGFHRREFGKSSRDIFLPDCFGFGYALPSIAAHCGLKSFSTQKLSWGSSVGVPFDIGLWEGVDGSSILAALRPEEYVGKIRSDLSHDTLWARRIKEQGDSTGLYAAYRYFGTGDTGGAPDSLSVDWLRKSIHGDGPIAVKSIGADNLVELVAAAPKAQLKRYNGELLMTRHGVGCYTSQAAMKRWNRRNELLADAAERASVAAHLFGGLEYPTEALRDNWTRFLWHQFHDDLTGTSIPEAYEYSWADELLCLNRSSSYLNSAVSAVAAQLDTRADGRALVLYNPLALDRPDVVEIAVDSTQPLPLVVKVLGPDKKEVLSQVVGEPAGGQQRLLLAAAVPSAGFAAYDVRPSKAMVVPMGNLKVSPRSLENWRYRVQVNDAGDVASIFDKVNNRELLAAPIRWELLHDKPRQWPAWEIQYEDIIQLPQAYVGGQPQFRILEHGPVRVALEITRTHNNSTFKTIIRLADGAAGERIDFVNEVDWSERETLLKAAFKLTTPNDSATYDLGLGTIQRGVNTPQKYEVPAHQWADLTARAGDYGVAIMNDCKYGWDHPNDSTLRLTLIHTPGVFESWAWVGDESTQDLGHHRFTYSITGHSGDWRQGNVPWLAAQLNQPLTAFWTQPHPGKLGKSLAMVKITAGANADRPAVMATALKKAESSDELIVRLRELHGRPCENISVSFPRAIVAARQVDGQEDEVGKATVVKGVLTTALTPYQPKAFAVRLAQTREAPVPTPVSRPLVLPFNLDGISTDAARTDGDFDGKGNTLAGDLVPRDLKFGDIRFEFGPTTPGANNVVRCAGQSLPIGENADAVYLLLAAIGKPTSANFVVKSAADATTSHNLLVLPYDEPLGQWNNRLVNGQLVEDAMAIAPMYVNPGLVAWAGSHRHTAAGTNDTYKFTYLFAARLDVGADDVLLILPDEPNLRVLAATALERERPQVTTASELYDTAVNPVVRIHASETAFLGSTTVELSSPTPGAVIRFTLDGSDPTESSPLYTGPLTITDSGILKARATLSGRIDSHLAKVEFRELTPRDPVAVAKLKPGMRCSYYEGSWQRMPDFDSVKVLKNTIQPAVELPDFARDEDFGLVFQGYFNAPEEGLYQFAISSDDGSKLWVADTLIVDNDGLHGAGEVPGRIALKAGYHPLHVEMFQCKGDRALELYVTRPDGKKLRVDADMVSYKPGK